jgi:hypothetical protein
VPPARAGRTAAVVADLDLHGAAPGPDGDPRGGGPRVLEHVGERLLHDPVGGEVDTGGQRREIAVDGVPA